VNGGTIDSNEGKESFARDRSNPNKRQESDILEDKAKYISQKKREEINELKSAL